MPDPAPTPPVATLDMPLRLREFIATLTGTEDAVYGKVLANAYPNRAYTLTKWKELLAAVKSAPLDPTLHGYVVGPAKRRR